LFAATQCIAVRGGENGNNAAEGLRRRELLLSLKYSTVEACFSVPALNLTMPTFPFILAYATSILRWPAWGIGVVAALPHICNFLQPPISRLLEKKFSLFTIMRAGFLGSSLPWFFVGPLNHWPNWHPLFFGIILGVSTLSNSICTVAWSSAISNVVPARISGSFFGRRNLSFGAWTLIVVLAAGKLVDYFEASPRIFGWIFAAAGAGRLTGLLFLTKMKFPKIVMERRAQTYQFRDLLKPLRDPNYRMYMLFVGCWGLFLNMGLPFYTVYLLRRLNVNVGHTLVLATLATLGGILTLKSWGALVDRFGAKPVQYVCAYSWCFVGLIAWSMTAPDREAHLYLSYLIVGGATAGFQLTQFTLMLRLIPPGQASAYIAVFLAATSALTCLGPLLGGMLIAFLPDQLGTVLGQPISDHHLLFTISFLGCLLSLPLLTAAREPAANEPEHVWRSMWRMRSFNPLLAAGTAASVLLTPAGLLSLGKYSIRTLRKQARNILDVGAEIVEGSQTILNRRR
jgi:MFS family permease